MYLHSLAGGENKSGKKLCGRADARQKLLTPALPPPETWVFFNYIWSYNLAAAPPRKANLLPRPDRLILCNTEIPMVCPQKCFADSGTSKKI